MKKLAMIGCGGIGSYHLGHFMGCKNALVDDRRVINTQGEQLMPCTHRQFFHFMAYRQIFLFSLSNSKNFFSVFIVIFFKSEPLSFASNDGKTKQLVKLSPSRSLESVINSLWNSFVILKLLPLLKTTFLSSITFDGLQNPPENTNLTKDEIKSIIKSKSYPVVVMTPFGNNILSKNTTIHIGFFNSK